MRLAILGAAVVAALLAIVASLMSRPERTWARIERTGTIRVGYSAEPPYAFRTADGHVTGESPELARAVLQRLGVPRIEWVQTRFHSLIPGLVDGRFDMIASGMFVTPEREREIAFSAPTYVAHTALLVRPEEAKTLRDLEALRNTGATLAVIRGSWEEQLARAAGVDSVRLLIVPDRLTGAQAVRTGRAGALAVTAPTARWLARELGDSLVVVVLDGTRPAWESAAAGHGAFGFRREDRQLRERFDTELRRLLGTDEHLALVRPFGFTAEDLPSSAGLERLAP